MSEGDDPELLSITTRVARLNQLVQGRAALSGPGSAASRDALIDALLALYDECNNTSFMRNQYIASFVNKYTRTIKELRNLRISINDFNIKNTIGRGHFGEVQVVREKSSGDVYALKVLHKADTLAQKNVAFYEEERDIMAKATSLWITQLQYAFQDRGNLYLVMEFHPGGDLLSLLARFDDSFEEKMARFYLAEMVLAIHALHTMGYVHRDVKPENILIDRTGHIKLADFGSACRLAVSTASVSNMPVGTPDYICPEVLMKMNSNDTCGQFGAECDWWSLGVCCYEMLYGRTPFTDEGGSMVVTYANIMNHKKCLKFPAEGDVSRASIDLMSKLLTEASARLQYEQICIHHFFSDVDFDNIRQTRPPFIPTVTSNDDTSNFEDFEKAKPRPDVEDFTKRSTGLTGKDLPFIGFTFTKPVGNHERPSLSSEVSSPAAKGSLERRLNQKSRELTDLRERYKELEHKLSGSASELNRIRNQLTDRDGRIEKLEAERRTLELDKAHYMTEYKSVSRLLEMEKQDRQQTEDKVMTMLDDIRKQSDMAQQLQDQTTKQEMEEHKEIISQLEEENQQLTSKISRLEHSLNEEGEARLEAVSKMESLKMKVHELKQSLKDHDKHDTERETHLQKELDKANQQRYEAVELLSTMRQSKTRLEEELYALRRRSNMEDVLRSRLSDAEDAQQTLEVTTHRLQLVERREADLRVQLSEKNQYIAELAERIATLEEENQEARLEHSKQEKLSQQRQEQLKLRIKDVEAMMESMSSEQTSLEEQSVLLTENVEEKLEKIHQQEQTIILLKGNISKLEAQVMSLKEDLSNSELQVKSRRVHSTDHAHSPMKRTVRRSGFSQTDTPPWKSLRRAELCEGETQTEDMILKQCSGVTPRTRSNQMQTEPKSHRSYNTQTDMEVSPNVTSRRRSNKTQTEPAQCKSNMAQTEPAPRRSNMAQTEPAQRQSNMVQTESVLRRSNIAQTETVTRRSNNVQTEVKIHVSMSAGPESPESADYSTETNSGLGESMIREGDEEEDISVSHTDASHCGQGDTPKKSKRNVGKIPYPSPTKSTGQQTDKEERRRITEELSDLEQHKAYLEQRLANLEQEAAGYKDSAHEQRIRALDLKIELRDKTTHLEREVSELKNKLDAAELALSDSKETTANSAQKEAAMRERLERTQQELDESCIKSRQKITDLQVERDDLEARVKSLTSRVTALEPKEDELRQYRSRCQELEPKNQELESFIGQLEDRLLLVTDTNHYQELESSLREVQEERAKLKREAEHHRDELQQVQRDHDQLKMQYEELKKVAAELDSQLQEYEKLSDQYEEKASKWSKHKKTYEKAVDERELELEDTQRNLQREKSLREKEEAKVKQQTEEIATLKKAHGSKVESLTTQLNEAREKMKNLAGQLTSMERANCHLDVDLRTARRHLDGANEDNHRLKEEISGLITSVSEIKASNLKLSKSLEEAMDRYELLASQNTDLLNQIESHTVNFNHDKYKLEATINQQTKLIDYLQEKVENPPKKKKGLFGSKKLDSAPGMVGIQFREMQHSLEHEREKNSNLRQTITRLQTELYQKQVEGQRVSEVDSKPAAMEALTLTPSSQPSSLSTYSIPKATPGGSGRPRKERMHHNIPHRFVTGLNSRPTKCAVCLGSVHFVKQAAKCQECGVACHPKCAPSLPASCGLPTEYVTHFGEVMTRARQSSSRISVADLNLKMSSWMKIPRPGKQLWEKKWVVLLNNQIHIYNTQDTSEDHVELFEMCPSNGAVTVHSAVTAAELTNTATSDLPYILRLEFEPETTCWPGRSIYLMALSFEEKQKWVATLEALVETSSTNSNRKEARLLGNTILSLNGEQRLELNCTLPLNDQAVLLGTDEGLFVMDLTRTNKSRAMARVTGVAAVYQMAVINGLDLVVLITGIDRQVVLVGLREIQQCVGVARPTVTPFPLKDAVACTTFAWGMVKGDVASGGGVYLSTALAERVLILLYDDNEGTFTLKKELQTSQPCSCIYFGRTHIIIGTDKFHKINLRTLEITDLLDKLDSTLAFAAFGAAHYDSFPIAVLQVAPPEEPEEFLLCYHEFGVFVDCYGARSRDDDMKWSGLPLAFAYRAPYLYIIHFNAVHVVEIPDGHYHHSEGARTMLSLPSPRYLGPALAAGAVYIGSSYENTAEILCFKGNMVTRASEEGKENLYAQVQKKPKISKRPFGETSSIESGFVSPDDLRSPPAIRKLAHSPVSSLNQRKMARVVTPKYTSSTSSDGDTDGTIETPSRVRVDVDIRARGRQYKREDTEETSSDTSY